MAFWDIAKKIPYPAGTSARFKRLDAYDRLLDGTFYSHLTHAFSHEFDGVNHVRLENRRPAVIYNLARMIADQTSALAFGDGHAPHVRCWDETGDENPFKKTEEAIEAIIDACDIFGIMSEAVFRGSIGSCAIKVRALPNGLPRLTVVRGKYARPLYDVSDPTTLRGLPEVYPTSGEDLLRYGYEHIDEDATYWMRIELGKTHERWFLPLLDSDYQQLGQKDRLGKTITWELDHERTYPHGFDVVPAVWIRNISPDGIDGQATFAQIVDMCVEIDYTLSQIGRGIKYTMDPLLVVRKGELASSLPLGGGMTTDGNFVKDPSNVMVLPAGAAAELLEINGKGFETSREYVRLLREYALEIVGGMKSDSENAKAAQSGRALELLHQALVWLVGRLRGSYGDLGFVPLLRILLRGVHSGTLEIPGVDGKAIDLTAPIRLVWPSWWQPRGADLLAEAQAFETLVGGGQNGIPVLPKATVTRAAAMAMSLTDPNRIVGEMELEEKIPSPEGTDQNAGRAGEIATSKET